MTAVPEGWTGTWRRLLTASGLVLVLANACSGDDQPSATSHDKDGAVDSQAPVDAALESGVSVDLCDAIGQDKVNGHTYTIANDFATAVGGDCRVLQILIPLTQDEGNAYLNGLSAWTNRFMGCEPGGVSNFGPADTGKFPTLSQTDVDILSSLYVATLDTWLQLSASQKTLVKNQLLPLASAAVNTPVQGPSLSLCSDAAADAALDAPPESSAEGSAEDAASDAPLESGASD